MARTIEAPDAGTTTGITTGNATGTATVSTPHLTRSSTRAASRSATAGSTPRGVSFGGVLRSEWIKLRSVRSTFTTYAAAAGLLLFFGTLAAAFTGGLLTSPDEGGGPPASDPTATVLGGSLLVALVVGTLGALAMTNEYSNGTIKTALAFVPRRVPVLAAKAVVLAAVTFPVMVVSTLATFFIGQAVLGAGDPGTATASLGDPGVLRAVLGTAAYLTGVTLMGLAFGALLRSTATALSALFALIFLVPGLGSVLLPTSIQDNVLVYLPSNAASAFTSVAPSADLLGTGAGAAVFAAWVLIPLVGAAVAMVRRPA